MDNFDNTDCPFEELDCEITADEVVNVVKQLKRNKALGSDQLMNEYFMESIDIIASLLCDIFNAIFNSDFVPEIWLDGDIIPLHEKGNSQLLV